MSERVAALVRGTLRPAEDWPTDGDRAAAVAGYDQVRGKRVA